MPLSAIEKIVVGIDFSAESERALEHAVAIARRFGAGVVLVHARLVIEYSDVPPRLGQSYVNLAELHQKEAHDQLVALRERHAGQGVEISHGLIDGYADTALEQAAAELGAGLIAVGTHGRAGVKRFLLGSVAERVVRLARRDVLVARPGRSTGGYQRILVPTDFSPLAELAIDRAIQLAAADATIDLFHCLPHAIPIHTGYTPVDPRTLTELETEQAAAADAKADALIARYGRMGIALRYDADRAPPGEAIAERAAGYDLVAIGSHGRRGLRRFLLGSVAELVVRHAPCSTLVVHAD